MNDWKIIEKDGDPTKDDSYLVSDANGNHAVGVFNKKLHGWVVSAFFWEPRDIVAYCSFTKSGFEPSEEEVMKAQLLMEEYLKYNK